MIVCVCVLSAGIEAFRTGASTRLDGCMPAELLALLSDDRLCVLRGV